MILPALLCGIIGGLLSAAAAGFAGSGVWIVALAYTGGGALAAVMTALIWVAGSRQTAAPCPVAHEKGPAPKGPDLILSVDANA